MLRSRPYVGPKRRAHAKAFLLAVGIAVAVPMTAHTARAQAQDDSGTDLDKARRHFYAGINLLQDPDGERVEEAYSEFKTSYALSKNPKVLGNIGYCALKLERDGEAIEAYTKYLSLPEIDAKERAQVELDLQTLKVGSVRVTLAVKGPEATLVDTRIPARGQPVVNVYGPVGGKITILVRSGHHVIKARVESVEVTAWEFTGVGGADLSHDLDTTPPAAPPSSGPPRAPSHAFPISLLVIGGAALAAGTVTGILALSKTKDVENACTGNVCPSSVFDNQRASAKTLATLTDALFIGGGVVAATGLGFLFFGGGGSSQAPANRQKAQASGGCLGSTCMAQVKVSF